jgi:energy-coupling factor transport system permease protein
MIAHFSYVARQSPIHRLHPASKVIFMLCFIFSMALFFDIRVLAILLAIGLTYYRLSGLRWEETRRAWTFVLVFVFVLVGISALLWGGGQTVEHPHVVWTGPFGFQLTWEKTYYAAALVMRMLGIASVSIPLTFTTRPQDYGVAFKGLRLPDKFAVALDLALRLVPTFASDFQSTLDAQRARGYETEALRGGPITKLRRMAPLLVPVTINAIVGGEDIINAMDLRAFGSGPRTWSRARRFGNYDRRLVIMSMLILVVSVAWALTGHGGLNMFWLPA